MDKKANLTIIFSVLVILFLISYWILNQGLVEFLEKQKLSSPVSPPPALSAEEKEKILSTLKARKKEPLTSEQKSKILNSLTAPE